MSIREYTTEELRREITRRLQEFSTEELEGELQRRRSMDETSTAAQRIAWIKEYRARFDATLKLAKDAVDNGWRP